MIKDTIANIGIYADISENLSQALCYLQSVKEPTFRAETVTLAGEDVLALHQEYTTEAVEGRLYENHDSHIDVQFVLTGTETIRVTDVGTLSASTSYDSENDVTLYELGDGTDVKLAAGDFVVLFPHDAHVPKLHPGKPGDVKKVVVKIAVGTKEA